MPLGGAAAAGDAVHRRPRAVADDLLRRPHDRLRARLRDLEARHRERPGRARSPITRRGAPSAPAIEHLTLNNRLPGSRAVARRPEGRVRRARRDLRGVGARRRRRRRASRARSRAKSQIDWAPDSRRIVYVSERDGVQHLFLYDFTTQHGNAADERRDGRRLRRSFRRTARSLAFVRDGKELRVIDLASKQERSLATGYLDARRPRSLAWSPDSRWVAYLGLSAQVVPERLSSCRPPAARAAPVSAMPNANANNAVVEPRRHVPRLQHQPAHRRHGRSCASI